VVCPAFFKGSVSAIEVAESISKGIRAALPDCSIIEIAGQLGLVFYKKA
jgi:glycerate kinase